MTKWNCESCRLANKGCTDPLSDWLTLNTYIETFARNGGGNPNPHYSGQYVCNMTKTVRVFWGTFWLTLFPERTRPFYSTHTVPCLLRYLILIYYFVCQCYSSLIILEYILKMRVCAVSLLQLLFVLLLGGDGSAVSSDCKSYDERSKSAGKSTPSVATADRKVVCSNMELRQVLPPDSFPNRTVTL